jgi:predicted HTH transcriptional regulator
VSYIMHNFRSRCIQSITELLKEKRKMTREALKIEIMKRFTVSEYTAERYIREIVMMKIAKENGKHINYIFDQPKTVEKTKKKEEKGI